MKETQEDSKANEEGEDVFRQLSGGFFLVVLALCIVSSIIVSVKSTRFQLMYLIGEFQVGGTASWILKGITLAFLGFLVWDSVFGSRSSVRIDIFESQKEGVSHSELYFVGFSLSLLSGFIILVILLLRGFSASFQDFSTPVSEENMFTGIYMVAVTAPLFEEFLFRFLLLLFPLALYTYWKSKKGLDKIYMGREHLSKKNWLFLLGNAVLFGFAHYGWRDLFGGVGQIALLLTSWKIAQTTMLGIILGFTAMRWGITTSMTIHWTINTLSASPTLFLDLFSSLVGLLLVLLLGLFFLVLIGVGIVIAINLLLKKKKG